MSDAVAARFQDRFVLVERGAIPVEGMGQMRTWFLRARRPESGRITEP